MQMGQSRWDTSYAYALLAAMGLNYGPAHQGITAIHLGEKQVLAQLSLPAVVKTSQPEYLLHPSLMDSALQASVGLIMNDVNQTPDKPYVPFVLESLRILSPCTGDMFAWLRYSQASTPETRTIKLDIDLCDHHGNICVQMRGFTSRPLEAERRPSPEKLTHISAHARSNGIKNGFSFDSIFYQKLITDVINHEVSVDNAVELALGHTNSN
jgi:acyl transferase domain-containing protein